MAQHLQVPHGKRDPTHVLRSSSISIVFCCPVAGLARFNFICGRRKERDVSSGVLELYFRRA